MSTETETLTVGTSETTPGSVVAPPRRAPMMAGGKVMAIVPTSMEEVYRLATAVCAAGMAPKGIDTPEKATIAILTGLELGMTPMAAMQRIAIVGNRPCVWGDAVIALVKKSGLDEYIKETLEGEGDSMVARCVTRRRGDPDEKEGVFSVADAKKAELWGKDIWRKYPKRMLQMRARAFCLRDTYADVLGGLYVAEELDDMDDAPRAPRPPAPPALAAPRPPAPPVSATVYVDGGIRRELPAAEVPKSEPPILFGITTVADDGSRKIVWDDPAAAAKSETAAELAREEAEQADRTASMPPPRPPRPPSAAANAMRDIEARKNELDAATPKQEAA